MLDFFAVSQSLAPATSEPGYRPCFSAEALVQAAVPWGPHGAVTLQLGARPRKVMAYQLQVPRPLPLANFDGTFDKDVWRQATEQASKMLDGKGILGNQPQVQISTCERSEHSAKPRSCLA